MLEAKTITIGTMEFQLNPLKGFTALKLDKKVISLMLPLIEGVENLDAKIDLGKALSGLAGALDNLEEKEYEKFIIDLLSTVIFTPPGDTPKQIDKNVIDINFQGEAITLYKLMFEVMRYNNFTPFVLVNGGGKGTMKTLISSALTKAAGN